MTRKSKKNEREINDTPGYEDPSAYLEEQDPEQALLWRQMANEKIN